MGWVAGESPGDTHQCLHPGKDGLITKIWRRESMSRTGRQARGSPPPQASSKARRLMLF